MKYIGNILTSGTFKNGELYNIVKNKEDLISDIPTLVIGWEFTKKMYPQANIIEKKIDDNTMWTYGKREKRQDFDENIEFFRKRCINNLIERVKYSFFNLLTADYDLKKSFFDEIMECTDIIVYLNDDMVYIYNPCKEIVTGFSLIDIDYMGKDRKNILSNIYQNKNIRVVDGKSEISMDMRIALRNYKYIIPYLCS